jgi:CheY-like chemotaxis protein
MPMHRSVLIVEDHDILRRTLTMVLSGSGFAVQAAQGGLDTLKMFEETQPDILLSDLNMPVMNGYEFIKTVRTRHP